MTISELDSHNKMIAYFNTSMIAQQNDCILQYINAIHQLIDYS